MMICPHCTTHNPPGSNFCQQCGRPIGTPPDATVALANLRQTILGPREQNLELAKLFASRTRLVVGRAPDCDVRLPHPSVSRYHARLERREGGLSLTDLGSVN